jgi:hypothetical protein
MRSLRHTLSTTGSGAWAAGSASDEAILELQQALGVELPADYKLFLREFGAFDFQGQSISGILDNTPLDPTGGSLYGDTLRFRRDSGLPNQYLVLQPDDDAPHCFDTELRASGGTMRVVSYELHSRVAVDVAQSFEEWVAKFFNSRGASDA